MTSALSALYGGLMTTTPQHRSQVPLRVILDDWRSGMTLKKIAAKHGVTRQRISQRLIEAGYSPAERRAVIRAETATPTQKAYLQQRVESVTTRGEAREEACDRLDALAVELGVRVSTLAQWCARQGPYATRRATSHVHPRYGTGALPPRSSPEGDAIALRALEAAKPWSVLTIASMASRRTHA